MIDRIAIVDMELYGYHGIFPNEQTDGTYYNINVDIYYDTTLVIASDSINDAINLVDVRNAIELEFNKRVGLLEKLADNIANGLLNNFPSALQVVVNIAKLNPPELDNVTCAEVEVIRDR